ncbi:flagellar M-ring protein FliF, partial [Hansschlegelia beijingensis]
LVATPLGADGALTAGDIPAGSRRLTAAEISGRKSESVDRLGELVRGNPSESVAIIRQWLQEPA